MPDSTTQDVPDLTKLLGAVNGSYSSLDDSISKIKESQDKAYGAKLAQAGAGEKDAQQYGKDQTALRDWSSKNPYPVPDIKPFTEQRPQVDPMKSFGSWASALGILAGALTRTPLTSSLRASAAAMSAIRQNDLDTFEAHRQAWKDNNDAAIKRADWEVKGYMNALDMMKTDQALGHAMIEAHAAAAGNVAVANINRAGDIVQLTEAVNGLQTTASNGIKIQQDLQDKIDTELQKNAIIRKYFKDNPQYKINPNDPQLAAKTAQLMQANPEVALGLSDALSAQKGKTKLLESGKDKLQAFIDQRRTEYEADHGAGSYTSDMELRDTKAYSSATGKGGAAAKAPLDTSAIKDPALRTEIDRYSSDPKHQAALMNAYDTLRGQDPNAKPTIDALENTARILAKGETTSQLDANQIKAEMADPKNAGRTYEEIKQSVLLKNKGSLTDDDAKFVAGMVIAGDKDAATGYGRSPADKGLIMHWVQQMAKDQSLSPADLAVRQADFSGMKAGERAIATRFVSVDAASHELLNPGGFLDQARQASAAFSRTNFPDVNQALKFNAEHTGDPAIRRFGAALQAVENTYAQLISRGAVSTDAARLAAHQLVTAVDSPAAFEGLLQQLALEAHTVLNAPGDVRRDLDAMVAGSTAADGANAAPVSLGVSNPNAVWAALPKGTRFLAPDGSGRILTKGGGQ